MGNDINSQNLQSFYESQVTHDIINAFQDLSWQPNPGQQNFGYLICITLTF